MSVMIDDHFILLNLYQVMVLYRIKLLFSSDIDNMPILAE